MNSKNVSIVIGIIDGCGLSFVVCIAFTIILSLCRAKEYSQSTELIGQCVLHRSAVQGEIQRASHPSGKCIVIPILELNVARWNCTYLSPPLLSRGLLCLLFAQDGGTLVPFSRTIPLLCVVTVLGTAIGVAECVYRWQRILLCGARVFVQEKYKI